MNSTLIHYREIMAKFPSTGKCGHPIKRGEIIGWNKSHGCLCSQCWLTWKAENAAAEFDEAQYASQYGRY